MLYYIHQTPLSSCSVEGGGSGDETTGNDEYLEVLSPVCTAFNQRSLDKDHIRICSWAFQSIWLVGQQTLLSKLNIVSKKLIANKYNSSSYMRQCKTMLVHETVYIKWTRLTSIPICDMQTNIHAHARS